MNKTKRTDLDGCRMNANGRQMKMWWTIMATDDGRQQTTNGNGWRWMAYDNKQWRTAIDEGWRRRQIAIATDDDCDKRWRQWMATNDNYDNNDIVKRFTSASSTTMACKREERKFFSSISCFFLKKFILFFVFSIHVATCSFDHSCKEPSKMKIEKWSLKKWRKPNVYRSRGPLANLHEELKQQRS
jgi:hypothetical protein